jgi:hypothetical protein
MSRKTGENLGNGQLKPLGDEPDMDISSLGLGVCLLINQMPTDSSEVKGCREHSLMTFSQEQEPKKASMSGLN